MNDFIILRRIVSLLSMSLAIARIKKSTVRTILILVLLVELVAGTASGAAFRLSFLDQEPVLADTCQLLRRSGFSEDSVATFKKLVEHHNKNGNGVDRTKFPAPQAGYYEFRDLGDFTNRLQTLLDLTPRDYSIGQENTFTCFDVACLLLRGAGCESPDFEKDLKSKGVVSSKDDPKAFRSDYHWALFPERGYERLTGRPRSEKETQLVLSVRAGRRVPGPDLTNEMAWRSAFATFVSGLKEGGFVFPRNFKLGLGFYVHGDTLIADHAFICIPKSGRLICLEKNGSPGPYVRAEFESEEDVARYMSWTMLQSATNPKSNAYGFPVLVSLNDQLIGVYPSGVDASISLGMSHSNVVAMMGNPTLDSMKCGPDRTSPGPSDAIQKGQTFLANLFDPDLGLLPEYRGANVYWLFHDNYLAAKVLTVSHPKIAQTIMAAIHREGVYKSGRIQAVLGESTETLPFRQHQLKDVRRVGNKVIRTEVATSQLFDGWEKYADLLFLACLTEKNQSAAHQHWEAAMRMWDGKGFMDEPARHDQRYSTFKLGLALLVASRLSPPAEPPPGAFDRLLALQDDSGGWITDYDATGKKLGVANVETTCLTILGIEAFTGHKSSPAK